ncbi:MAG: hypothetical protein KH134_20470 [Enterobacter cloacae]|nr:hypothetical protein [Enterobacter cloacae]
MIKRIKNEENVKGFIVQNDVEKMLIHYSEQVKGKKEFPKAVYVVPTKILIVLDKKLERNNLKEFIEYLESVNLPTNDMRYM